MIYKVRIMVNDNVVKVIGCRTKAGAIKAVRNAMKAGPHGYTTLPIRNWGIVIIPKKKRVTR